jgi:hypothetical protein
MRALSIQVQPARSPGLDLVRLRAEFEQIAASELVQHHRFAEGQDKGPYLNFTFGTDDAGALWQLIRARIYDDEGLGDQMRRASMALCSSDAGWDDYTILYHFNPEAGGR